MAMKNVFIGSP